MRGKKITKRTVARTRRASKAPAAPKTPRPRFTLKKENSGAPRRKFSFSLKRNTPQEGPNPGEEASARPRRRGARVDRLVLLVGDEGAVLVHVKKGKVVNRAFSPTPTPAEMEGMHEIAKGAPSTPLYIVFDTVDQTYIQQTLPPVTALSINKLIKRRLERDFSADYIKGALTLGREKSGRKDWLFMMAALQQTGLVKAWLEVATQWPNRCTGIFLLPVEAIEVQKRLHAALHASAKPEGENEGTPDWEILVSYNKVSGIRQVIFNKGNLVLTRLGQPAMDASAETIAGTIEQEIIGTKEYLKRLSYQDREALNLTIIASDEIGRNIEIAKLRATRVTVLTPYQASEALGLEGAAQPSDRFGDSFLCAALATNKKRRLTLSVNELRSQQTLQLALHSERAVGAVALVWLLVSMGSTLWDVYTIGDQLEELQTKKTGKDQEMEALKKKSTRTPQELERVAEVVKMYDVLTQEALSPDAMLSLISQAITGKAAGSVFTWELKEKKDASAAARGTGAAGGSGMNAPIAAESMPKNALQQADSTLTVEFAGAITGDRKLLQQGMTEVLNQLKAKLPQFDVRYLQQPALFNDNERIDVNLNQGQPVLPKPEAPKAGPVQAKLSLIGPAQPGDANVPQKQTP